MCDYVLCISPDTALDPTVCEVVKQSDQACREAVFFFVLGVCIVTDLKVSRKDFFSAAVHGRFVHPFAICCRSKGIHKRILGAPAQALIHRPSHHHCHHNSIEICFS
ncbi:uncharacterized protein LOC126672097 isoform X2 [Mercurialis annua]|uniref:uncharacterized protein LOC126672097 isoform X2 n=1 Tax=Mercurialis annua TaxID=3986 RepID=UPI002160B9AB|nr:uncharacterized protein LOC126672097 isoform X2 [Mercurialis annua]